MILFDYHFMLEWRFRMLFMILNFFWMFISSFSVGMVLNSFLNIDKKRVVHSDLSLILMLGIVGLTIYAEIFSVFHRVGFMATAILFCIVSFLMVIYRKEIVYYIVQLFPKQRNRWIWGGIIGIIFFYFAAIATKTPDFYDSSLYHGQAIQWIEKYGIVKGLGNLHNRFAYNSAFLCLQALYSWNFVIGQSLHGMNAYVGAMMIIYSLTSFSIFKKKKQQTADSINLLIIIYIFASLDTIASPNTDFLALVIVLYVLSMWTREAMKDEKDDIWGRLCIIAIYGITVKLSIAPIILLMVKPVYLYAHQHAWKKILHYGIVASACVLPFLIRNILISGYLIYPYTILDVFNVDWKMPKYTVDFDAHEIISWGRGLCDVQKYTWSFSKWFPIWISKLGLWNIILLFFNILLAIGLVFVFIKMIKHKQLYFYSDIFLVSIVSIVSLGTWLLTAPLIRYGWIYLYLLPAIFCGMFISRWLDGSVKVVFLICLAGIVAKGSLDVMSGNEKIPIIFPHDYPTYECREIIFNSKVKIYVPIEGDRTGYGNFPAIPYPDRLNTIEMRGEEMEDGFRTKDEYFNLNVTTYGNVEK